MDRRDLMINVQPGVFGRCAVQGRKQKCGKMSAFLVFTCDGKPKPSRLDSHPCAEHLPYAVRQAKKSNEALAGRMLEAEKDRARKLLGLPREPK